MVRIAGISMVALSWNAMTDAISAATMGTIWLLDIARAGPPDVDSARGGWLTTTAHWLNADAGMPSSSGHRIRSLGRRPANWQSWLR